MNGRQGDGRTENLYLVTHVLVSHCQVYKFLYACRLLDWGLVSQAFHYCEVVGGALIAEHEPSMVLLREVVKVSGRPFHFIYCLFSRDSAQYTIEPDYSHMANFRL